jgi:hypothetical protein
MFAEPSILETITIVAKALHQYEGAGGSAPTAASEASVEVLDWSAAGAESVVDVSPPSSAREGMVARLP